MKMEVRLKGCSHKTINARNHQKLKEKKPNLFESLQNHKNRFLLLKATKYLAVCYSSHRRKIPSNRHFIILSKTAPTW
jgi:hypothetical protein